MPSVTTQWLPDRIGRACRGALNAAITLSLALTGAAQAQGVKPPAGGPTGAQQMQRAAEEEAQAQETKAEPAAPEAKPDAPLKGEEKRAKPNYDGRGPRGTSFGEALLWVPRIIASPLYLTTKYAIALPLGALVTTAEKNNWPAWAIDFFTFGENHEGGWIPLITYDFGLRPTIGVYFFWNPPPNSFNATVAYGGSNWVALGLSAGHRFSERTSVSLSGSFRRRSDMPFYGIGPSSSDSFVSRYAFQREDGSATFSWRPAWWSTVQTTLGIRDFRFRTGSCCNDPPLADRVAVGQLPAPPGFQQPYTVLLGAADVAFDSRPPRPASQTGVRLALNAEEDVATSNTPQSWIRYGGFLGGFWDITGHARVLSLSLFATFVDQTAGNVIPFTELATLGGSQPFVGFLYGRLVDRSAIATQLRYEWPIWSFIDGELHAAVGNVFGPHLDGLRAGLLRLSTGIGFRSVRTSGPGFEFLFGLGTETFDSGMRVSSWRFAVGSTYGF